MECSEVLEILDRGEDSKHQFKASFDSIDKLAVEIAAFANSDGGMIIVGASDEGKIYGLARGDISQMNQWISNATSSKIEPPIFVKSEILTCDKKRLLVIHVEQGKYKPYAVNKVAFWVKNGADKRRATREELLRLAQSSRFFFADELVTETGLEDFDVDFFLDRYAEYYPDDFTDLGIPAQKLLVNLKLMSEDNLTLAGLLLFGINPESFRPQFGIKATFFAEDDISSEGYIDAETIHGKLSQQFKSGIDFVKRNLRRKQMGRDFNAPGILEIPEMAFAETIANAIVHRDYFISSPIQLHLFSSRLEIVSPGTLPNTVTEENIKYGVHVERNPTILTFLEKDADFRYSGRGSGIPRVIRLCNEADVELEFENDTSRQQFRAVFHRD